MFWNVGFILLDCWKICCIDRIHIKKCGKMRKNYINIMLTCGYICNIILLTGDRCIINAINTYPLTK